MTLETVRQICRALPDVTEDVKWGDDLAFMVGGKMFAVVYLEPPHHISFKCSPEAFAELVERDGVIPAPYLARAMWVQEQRLGEAFERRELERLLQDAYALVRAKLPASAALQRGKPRLRGASARQAKKLRTPAEAPRRPAPSSRRGRAGSRRRPR